MVSIKKPLIACIAFVLVGAGCASPQSSDLVLPKQGAAPFMEKNTKDFFISAIPVEQLDNLRIENLPSSSPEGYLEEWSAIYRNRLLRASSHHILEYDEEGNVVRYTDSRILDCPEGLPGRLAAEGETLYVACGNDGIYEVDLNKNRVVHHFGIKEGLANTNNMRLAMDGNTLWVGTFSGLFKIDRTARTVRMYRRELGGHCRQYPAKPYVYNHDVWVTFGADEKCGGGAAHYLPANDTWMYFGPESFLQGNATSIDFSQFIISKKGVYAVHMDHIMDKPSDVVLEKFHPDTTSWSRLSSTSSVTYTPRFFDEQLPQEEEYQDIYLAKNDVWKEEWRVKTIGGWKDFSIPSRRYLTVSRRIDDRYFLLSTAGLEQFVKGQDFPELLAGHPMEDKNGRLVVSGSGRFVMGLSDAIQDMGGEWLRTTVTIYDRETKSWFATEIKGSPDGFPPVIGMRKDPSLVQLTERENGLYLTEVSKDVFRVDWVRRRLDPI